MTFRENDGPSALNINNILVDWDRLELLLQLRAVISHLSKIDCHNMMTDEFENVKVGVVDWLMIREPAMMC